MTSWDEFDRPDAERSTEKLDRIVRYQRWLIAVVLGQLALWVGYIVLGVLNGGRFASGGGMRFTIALTVILGVVGGIFVFLLAFELRGTFAAVVFGLATLVPCMGLIILTLVNGYATTELRKHGIKVGMFGARAADIRNRPLPYEDDDDAGW